MGRIRTWSAAGAVVVAGALLVTLSPSGGTDAQWRDSANRSLSGPSSDTFGMTATNVADTGATPWPNGRMTTTPQVTLANQSGRQTSWVNVQSTRVNRVVTSDTSTNLLAKTRLDYTYGTGACDGGSQGQYWNAGTFGQITHGTTVTRPGARVDGATLAPGQSRTLCPKVTLDYPSTTAGRRAALLNHGGRALDITTVVNQRTEAPATWASTPRTVTSRYRLAMPAPATPSGSDVCQRTLSNGNPSSVGYYGGFFWGWPDAATADYANPPATPAMAGGWDIMRQTANGGWEVWKSVPAGSERRSAGHNSRDIDPSRDVVRNFKLRGYPFAGDKSRYVESDWIARAENDWSLLTDRWECHPPLVNPDAGPHNMP